MGEALDAAKGNNEFAIELYQHLARCSGAGENIFFSPHSISSALAMAYAGSRGETAVQISRALRFGRDQEKFHLAFAASSRRLLRASKRPGCELHSANSV